MAFFVIVVVQLAENAFNILKHVNGGATTEKIREGKRQAKREVKEFFNHIPCAKHKEKILEMFSGNISFFA